jgi:NAD(P)H-dependent flavin oxidoreductase YrpB (nitropropane dioxygenase family)
MLGIDFPIFAFTHCRDVVAAVSNAGGFGVLGAVAHTPELLDTELRWIREQTKGRPFGVDLLIPRKYVGAEQGGLDAPSLRDMVPPEHREWVDELLRRYDVPPLPPPDGAGDVRGMSGLRIDPRSMAPLIDVALEHQVGLIASALGTPPAWLVEAAHQRRIPVAALAGRLDHAVAHKEAGVDIVIAQGTEGGGHTGDIATMV